MYHTDTVLDHVEKQNPKPWWRKATIPGALELAAASLEECRRNQLEHADKSEFHGAMKRMLCEREKRLINDLERLRGTLPEADGN